jgi:hypothetical protein
VILPLKQCLAGHMKWDGEIFYIKKQTLQNGLWNSVFLFKSKDKSEFLCIIFLQTSNSQTVVIQTPWGLWNISGNSLKKMHNGRFFFALITFLSFWAGIHIRKTLFYIFMVAWIFSLKGAANNQRWEDKFLFIDNAKHWRCRGEKGQFQVCTISIRAEEKNKMGGTALFLLLLLSSLLLLQ